MLPDNILHKNIPLLEVDDPLLMDMLFADPKASECLLERLSDNIALVDPEKFDALYARLRKMDYLPKVNNGL
jgi:hypothetical protein